MTLLNPDAATSVVSHVFRAHGVPEYDADIVARELVEAERLGVRSHGVIRVAEYLAELASGNIRTDASPEVIFERGASIGVDGHHNFGIVTAYAAVDAALEKAKSFGVAAVVTRNCNHVNRLGSYAALASEAGFIAIATAAVPPPHHVVVPWGGAEARLGTNPIAFGVPATPNPIVSDFATSVMPEGRVRLARADGRLLPDGVAISAEGKPTQDPAEFYGPPRGALMPFGGPVGYKGYALSILSEVLGGALAGDVVDEVGRQVNGLFLIALDPKAFLADSIASSFESKIQRLGEWLRATVPAPGVDIVRLPGDLEYEQRSKGPFITVSDAVWSEFSSLARAAGVSPTSAEAANTPANHPNALA